MSKRSTARITGHELGMRPRNYGHLVMLASRYAQARLHGRAVVNRATRRPILLDWHRGLGRTVAPGTPPELLLSLPALPRLLAEARYLGPARDSGHCSCGSCGAQIAGFGGAADVIGRPIEIRLITRDDGRGRLVFERASTPSPLIAPREDGGILPDGPAARSAALHAVLSRAYLPAHRQDGGANDGGMTDEADDGGEALQIPSTSDAGVAPEQIAFAPSSLPGNEAMGMSSNVHPVLKGDPCEEQRHDEEQICRALSDETPEDRAIRSRCWESVKNRNNACKNGRPREDWPPLITWREGAPATSPRPMPSLPLPLIIPLPPGGDRSFGHGGGFFGGPPRLLTPFD
jgi:hypothetical protein